MENEDKDEYEEEEVEGEGEDKNEKEDYRKYFYHKDIDGDGNCLFSSIFCQVKGFESVQKLREEIVEHLKKNQSFFQAEIKDKTTEYIEKYKKVHLIDMLKNGTWGTDVEIIMAASLLNKIIFNITIQNGKFKNLIVFYPNQSICQYPITEDKFFDFSMLKHKKFKKCIYLAWNGKNHWDALMLK